MRFGQSPTLIGSLGTLVQRVVGGINSLAVTLQGGIFDTSDTSGSFSFMKFAAAVATAAKNGKCQLLNAAASGKTVYVDKIVVDFGAPVADGTAVNVSSYAGALATDAGAGINMALGGTAATSHVFTDIAGTGPDGTVIHRQLSPASVGGSMVITFNPPLGLAASTGVEVTCLTANLLMACTFYWREY